MGAEGAIAPPKIILYIYTVAHVIAICSLYYLKFAPPMERHLSTLLINGKVTKYFSFLQNVFVYT